jgi:cytochrome c peroxidase
MRTVVFLRLIVAVGSALGALGCGPDSTPADFASMELTLEQRPPSPTNKYADDQGAAALGKKLFFDKGLSAEGTISCASCHASKSGFSDPEAFSEGVRKQRGGRHSMPVTAAVFHPFLLWDGKADSAWSQPLKALENPKEMDFSRVEVARRVSSKYAGEYEAIFGPLPDLSPLPARAMPGLASWEAMSEAQRDQVQRVFVNVGKAIEAYERKILCTDTRFDRWVRGEEQLSDRELKGADVFRERSCARCHAGPSFSDGFFHNVGIPSADRGRADAAQALLDDPFNGAGKYSDDAVAGQIKLAFVQGETAQEGAFRTASLRGVGQRAFFGHASHQQTLRGFLLDVYQDGRRRRATVGTIDPVIERNRVEVERDDVDDLVAFLRTLDCPPVAPDLLEDPQVAP